MTMVTTTLVTTVSQVKQHLFSSLCWNSIRVEKPKHAIGIYKTSVLYT